MSPEKPESVYTHDGQSALDELRDCLVHVMTFGCAYNMGDSRKLEEILKAQDCTIVDTPKAADAVVVNTCTVVGSTERRMLRTLRNLKEKNLYVTGCMPVVQKEEIFGVCSPKIIFPNEIGERYRNVRTVQPAGVGILQVASGCLGTCSYCITRNARGRLRSFPKEEILVQADKMVKAGAKELQLTGQDVSAWGREKGWDLSQLLNEIVHIPGKFYIRLGMMNPSTLMPIIEPLIEAYRSPKIFNFLHIPAQSGSDEILNAMKRKYSAADVVRIVEEFREACPDISLATDIIVGFPGETDEQFRETMQLISRIKPNKVNITRFSMRPHTDIAGEDDLVDSLKKKRSRILLKHAEALYHEINAGWIGKETDILVTEKIRHGSVISRTPNYQNVVIQRDLPVGYEGHAVILEDRKYYFIGALC
ncbi:MAG TPA: tRNA (N(6)-L-threonylcarbamoyladenosine(37)-C(2))-methylthiotransferase [Methanoregulaceae archaeon]|nr:tRNA (N(6)-L-threonylcarbamoyladenosine(37)-C(2))-methylthiotransferase [Methanoregulaceae archaeon]